MSSKAQSVGLDHLNLSVNNFADSVDWYGKVFGFRLVEKGMEDDGPWGILRSGDSMLCIYESPRRKLLDTREDADDYHQLNHFGLRIHDVEEWKRTIKEYAIPLHYWGEVRYPYSTSWYISDPTGHTIEVAHWDKDEVRFT